MQKRARIGQLALSLALGLVSLDVAAERLDTVNVTATRTARTVDQTLAAVEIITREDIENSQANNLYELVAGLPGIDVATSGGYGKTDSLYIRGTKTGHLLVLVNGVRVGSATLGRTALEQFSLSQIERIEIVRGPRSHLYGSEAIGGVLQIFTRQGERKNEINAEIGFGSYQTREISTGFNGYAGTTGVNLQMNWFETGGINALDDNNPDHDGYDSTSVSGSISHNFSNGLQIALNGMQIEATNEYDNVWFPDGRFHADLRQQLINGKLDYLPNDYWSISLVVAESRDEIENFQDDFSSSEFKTKRGQITLQNDLYFADTDIVTVGFDYYKDEVAGSNQYQEEERNTRALFMQYQTEVDVHNLILGARHDETQGDGGHTTGNLAWSMNWTPAFRSLFSYGTGFKQPTFNDLYYIDPFGFGSDGNPDLKPEKSESYEIGLTGIQGWGKWNLHAYQTNIDDLIEWVEVSPWVWRPRNVNQAEIRGVELKIQTELAGWFLIGNLSLTDARDSKTDNFLINRARESARLDISRTLGATTFNASLLAQGDRYADAENSKKAKGYAIVDLGLNHRLDKSWLVKARVKNLFDKQYQTTDTYNTPGTELFLSIAYQTE